MACNTESYGEESKEVNGEETKDDSTGLTELEQEVDICKQGVCGTQG